MSVCVESSSEEPSQSLREENERLKKRLRGHQAPNRCLTFLILQFSLVPFEQFDGIIHFSFSFQIVQNLVQDPLHFLNIGVDVWNIFH